MGDKSLTVGVVGAGTMGVGIAVTVSRAGHRTIVCDQTVDAAAAGLDKVVSFLDRSVALGKLPSGQRDVAVDGLQTAGTLEGLAGCDVVVEAIFEDLAVKTRLMSDLEAVCRPDALFHTNTSTLSVTAIAGGCNSPERVIGTHYCNPAPMMPLVEVVKGIVTSEETHARTVDFVESLDKQAVTVQDTPGFLVNRFLVPFENDCLRALEAGAGTVESIDKTVKLGLNYPMGPFTLLDIVGLDIHRAVSLSLYEQLRDSRFAPPPIVERMIGAGHLGRKTGRGSCMYSTDRLFGT